MFHKCTYLCLLPISKQTKFSGNLQDTYVRAMQGIEKSGHHSTLGPEF